jgi:hypothetical protein
MVGGKQMLELAWTELGAVTRRIDHLQAQRDIARTRESVGKVRIFADELDRAINERDRLVARIALLINAGALECPEPRYRLAA